MSGLIEALDAAVPLHITQLQTQGGPTAWDLRHAREVGQLLGAKGDVLLFGGKPGEAATICNALAHALAVLAFSPDGVQFGGRQWETPQPVPAGSGVCHEPVIPRKRRRA